MTAGASIGAINAAIIIGSKNEDEPAKQLENFWLPIAETITSSIFPDNLMCRVSLMYAATCGNLKAGKSWRYVLLYLAISR